MTGTVANNNFPPKPPKGGLNTSAWWLLKSPSGDLGVIGVPVTASLRLLFLSCLISLVSCLSAQEERSLTREGNKYFDKQKFPDAEASYKKALEKKNNFPEAIFNLGDAIYRQGRFDDAAKQFELASRMLTDPKQKAQAFHNEGNSYMEKKEWQNAADAYKQALRYNPTDKDTKYNLAYANAKLRDKQQNQQNKKDQNQQNKDNKDKKDDKGDKDKKGDQDKKDNQGDKKDEKPKRSKQGELSKEQADKLLQALKAEEQKTQEKMQKKLVKPQDVKIEKDW